jgi:hypothetical protein
MLVDTAKHNSSVVEPVYTKVVGLLFAARLEATGGYTLAVSYSPPAPIGSGGTTQGARLLPSIQFVDYRTKSAYHNFPNLTAD